MFAAAASPEIVNVTIIESKLAKIDSSLFANADAEINKKLVTARKVMFRRIRASGFTRYKVGIAVRRYHAFYKEDPERAWRDKVGPIITEALGYGSLKSLYNLMDDTKLARKLGPARRNALVALGIDPASRKYAELVKTLLPAPPSESPQNAEAAVTVAHAKFLADRKQRSDRRRRLAGDPQEFRRRIADQLTERIVLFINHVQGQDPIAIFDEIAKQVRAQLAGEVAKFYSSSVTFADVAKPNAGPVPVAATGQNRLAKSAGAHGAATAKPILVPPKPSTKSLRVRGPAHPWGDACINSLRIFTTGSDGAQQIEFNRQRLYEVRDDRSPKRFLVNDSPDLFDVESDDVIREHLSVFGNAKWHLFLLLTNNLERAKRIRLAMKASGVIWPFNVWIGTSIECREDVPKIKFLAELGLDTIWISFADYRSNSKYPLADSALAVMLKDCRPRWIIGRADLECLGPDFSVTDARHLRDVAWSPGVDIAIFFAQPRTKAAFVSGEDIPNPVTHDPTMIELLKTKIFPEGFELQRPPKLKPSSPSEREPVEIIGYLGSKAVTR